MSEDANAATDAEHDYLSDVPYLRTFSNDLSPALLRLAVALNGFLPPPEHDFDYLELGCGNGDTLTTLAAMYPRARFVGVDLSAEHVAFARGLARRGGLENVRFVEADFEAFSRAELPALDYVCLYGVLSWISPAKRRAALALAREKLKVGGVLFASYNAMPGWAAVAPLRRLLLDTAAGAGGTSLDRAHRGLSIAKLLADAGAQYFITNPAAKEMLETALQTGLAYTVHEYFSPDWHPMYFEDVAREMAAEGLHFVAQLPLFLNYRDLAIPASLASLFQGVSDRVAFESLKDYALNQFFRRDLYMKGACPRADETTRDYLDHTLFGTVASGAQVKRSVALSSYTLRFVGPIFDHLIPALAAEATSVSALARSEALRGYDQGEIRDAVAHLVIGDQVLPMMHAAPALHPTTAARYRVVNPYNRMILEQPLTTEHPLVLASPATGQGLVVPLTAALCLRALTEVSAPERATWLRAFVAEHGPLVHVAARSVGDAAEQLDVLENEVEVFASAELPKLVQLGIIAPDEG